MSSYYALYSDTSSTATYQKFPTTSPYHNHIGLNLAQFGLKYNSNKSRGIFTMQFGDIPNATWPSDYKVIQEANAGIKLAKKLWLDAGFFRTHIGIESIQPRENITSTLSIVCFYEPYFLSGAKLTYLVNDKLALQLNAFNGFNGFVENNQKKAVGFSLMYNPDSSFSMTFNSMINDDTPDSSNLNQVRYYFDYYAYWKKEKFMLGFELNYGFQTHSLISDMNKTGHYYSGLIAGKYYLFKKLSPFGRIDYMKDANDVLTGLVLTKSSQLIGLDIISYVIGLELKILKNSYLRFENRLIQNFSGNIFSYKGKATTKRYETMFCMGVWF